MLQERVTFIHAKLGTLSDALAGISAASFLVAENVMKAARINVTHVAYRGNGQVLTAVLSV